MNEYVQQEICTLTLSISMCPADETINVDFFDDAVRVSSLSIPYSPDEHPEFNERVGNELYWYINDRVRALYATKDLVEQTGTFPGTKSGKFITIEKYGEDDYSAWWHDHESGDSETAGYSVRGTKQDIIDEIIEEV